MKHRQVPPIQTQVPLLPNAYEEAQHCLRSAAPELFAALADLLAQLEGIGIYIPGEDAGQWADAEGLSFAQAEKALASARG